MFGETPQEVRRPEESGHEPDLEKLLKPIQDMGSFPYNPEEDEVAEKRMEWRLAEQQIQTLLKKHFSETDGSNKYLDAKSYLEGRLRAVQYKLNK